MHRNIKHFFVEGHVTEAGVVRLRQTMDNLVLTEMNDKGYVPVYGLGPYLRLTYDFENERHNYLVSAYGVFVGSEGVTEWDGIDPVTGTLLPRHSQPSMSSTSSTSSV